MCGTILQEGFDLVDYKLTRQCMSSVLVVLLQFLDLDC